MFRPYAELKLLKHIIMNKIVIKQNIADSNYTCMVNDDIVEENCMQNHLPIIVAAAFAAMMDIKAPIELETRAVNITIESLRQDALNWLNNNRARVAIALLNNALTRV